jgi:ABC-2 type transport system permease protein
VSGSLRRIYASVLRLLYLHKRSLPRNLEICFWPVMDLLVWGFLTVYLRQISAPGTSEVILFLIGAMIFWDIMYRAQQGITIPLMEEFWSRSVTNLLITPIRTWEWITAMFTYGVLKIAVTTVLLCAIAFLLYQYNIIMFGPALIPFVFNLLFFGWALGIFTAGLLIRWSHSAEAFIWGVPFFIQPVSAVFYPLEVLPGWIRWISISLPSTHVFEGMRAVLREGFMPWRSLILSASLNVIYFAVAALFFAAMMARSRRDGRLAKLGQD